MRITEAFFIVVCSLAAHCSSGQTNENPNARAAHETYERTTWGTATNGVQFGIRICAIGPSDADKLKICSYLYDATSTNIYGLWRLPPGYRFEMTLKTQDGEEIEKTRKGSALCRKPSSAIISNGRVVVLDPKLPQEYDEVFDLRDCFNIVESGSYILRVKAKLYAMKAYNEFVRLEIPEATIQVVLDESDLEK